MSVMGFSQIMMNGVLSANSMLLAARAQRSAIAKTEGRIRILESEIKLGTGATEAKKQELSSMQERLKKANELQLGTLEDANARVDDALEQARKEKDNKVLVSDENNDEEKKTIQEIYKDIMEENNSINETISSKNSNNKYEEKFIGMSIDYLL